MKSQFSKTSEYTVWKLQVFSIIHILREINFEEFRSSKSAVFCNFRGSEIDSFVNFSLQKCAKIHENQIPAPQNVF